MTTLCSFISLVLALLPTKGCVDPTGFGSNPGEIDPDTISIPDLFSILGPLIASNDEYQETIESIIDFRLTWYANLNFYNVIQAYDSTALDAFARLDVSENRRRCTGVLTDTNFFKHQLLAQFYGLLFLLSSNFPPAREGAILLFESIGLDPYLCENSDFDCTDVSTPWGLGLIVQEELEEWRQTDGWNADGSYNREYFRIPYEDWRDEPYVPSNDPWKLRKTNKWQPLLEHDGEGFLYNQEHVVPHIGYTGRSLFIEDSYFCSLEAEDPDYDYDLEIELLFERLRNLTPQQKMEIEYFDNKERSLIGLNVAFRNRLGLGINYESLLYSSGSITSVYEAALAVWRSKVEFDRVRPTSIIHDKFEDDIIENMYAGTDSNGIFLGNQNVRGRDWQPYIRTMPHAEYPSGSACVCEAWAEFHRTYSGIDSFDTVGGPLEVTFLANSSHLEPGSTPPEDITISFSSFSDISNRCGQSRLNGGMHFTASVPNGADLCRDIGRQVAERYASLAAGEVPDYVKDFNDRSITQDRCPNESDSESQSRSRSRSDSESRSHSESD